MSITDEISSTSRFGRDAARTTAALALTALSAWGWSHTETEIRVAVNSVVSYLAVWAWLWVVVRWSNRQFALRFALVTGGVMCPYVVLEMPAVLGWLDYRLVLRTPVSNPLFNPYFVWDDELLFRNPPGAHRKGVSAETSITRDYEVLDPQKRPFDLRFDERGFRNPSGLDRADVAFVGDSFTEGMWVTYDELWTTQVARRIGRPVANFGTNAWGPRQELIALRRYALSVKPRLVVWAFFEGNDLGDLRRYDRVLPQLAAVRAERHRFRARSLAKNLIVALTLLARSRPPALPRSGLLTLADGSRQRTYFEVPGTPLQADDEEALGKLSGVLAEAERACAAAGAKLLVVYVPDKFRVYQGLVEFAPDAAPRSWTVNDLPERVRTLVERLDPPVEFFDLTSALRASASSGTPPYFTDDTHWSAEGHVIAATATAELIVRLSSGR